MQMSRTPGFVFRWMLILVLLTGAAFIWSEIASRSSGELVVAFLDVGQGDAIFIQSPTGNQFLLDGGPDRKVVAELARVMPLYDRTIDMLALSHPHADHLAGLLAVLERYEVAVVADSGTPHETGEYESWKRLVLEEGSIESALDRGDRIDLGGGAYLEVLLPKQDVSKAEPHEGMLVMRLVYGETEVMLTGDMEENLESELVFAYGDALSSDILKVGHHGSLTSSSLQFLEAVDPEIAVIQVGEKNRYGHPKAEIVDRLRMSGAEVYRTDKDGTLVVRSDGVRYSIDAEK